MSKVKPNAKCRCGSGKKYKKCCMREDRLPFEEQGLADPGPVSRARKDATDRMMAEEGWTHGRALKLRGLIHRRRSRARSAAMVWSFLSAYGGVDLEGPRGR